MSESAKQNIPASLSEKEVEALKAKHKVFHYQVEDKQAWFRNPTLKVLTAAQVQKDTAQYYYTLARNCFIAGDPDVIENEEYFIVLMRKLDDLTTYFTVEVKKL